MSRLRSRLGLRGPVLCYMAVIFYHRPRLAVFRDTPDYLLHLRGYCVLSVLYGMSDEWHQSFAPGREASWLDVTADGAGASLAAAGTPAWQSAGRGNE